MQVPSSGKAPDPWDGQYKIPWHDPDFSGRMLAEHLTQDHDLASRKEEVIAAQVQWLHEHACALRPCRVLDIACGPGLYSVRLAELGHGCRGIDFGPASIAYAQEHATPRCEFVLGDIRSTDFGEGYDVAMLIYGEFNVFPPTEIRRILEKARAALIPGGRLLVETQTAAAVRESGLGPAIAYEASDGLFSASPHRVSVENTWYEEQAIAQQRFEITDLASGAITTYRNTSKAWTEEEIVELLCRAGFGSAQPMPAWPVQTPDLQLFLAH